MHSPSFYMCMFYFPKLFVFSQIREIEGLDDPQKEKLYTVYDTY